MARSTIRQRISLDGGKEIEAQLRQIGDAGEKAFGRLREAAARADFARFGASISTFGRDLSTVAQRFSLAFAGLSAAAAGAATGIFELAKSGADAADEAGRAAQATGLQVDAYGRLVFAAEQAGVAQEAFSAAMSRLNKAIGEAAKGSKNAQALFDRLGVSLKDSEGRLRPTEAIVRDVAEAFSKLPDGAKKSALAIELFGKSGASLLPFLNEGREGLADLGEKAEKLGVVFTKQQAEIGDALGDTVDEVKAAANGIGRQVGLLFAPAITAGAARLRDAIIENRDAILDFARRVADSALPVVEDLIALISGKDAEVKSGWLLELRDSVVDFGQSAKSSFSDILLPALSALKKGLDTAAEGLRIFTGIDVSGTALGIAIAVGQATGAFRLLYSAVVLAKDALLLLLGNPALAAIAAVAGGIALWATSTDTATAAMQTHEGIVGRVEEAYRKAGLQVANMTKEIKDGLFVDAAASLSKSTNALESELDSLRSKLLLVSKQEGVGPIVQQFENGAISAQKLIEKLNDFGRNNIDLAPDVKQLVEWAKAAADLERAIAKDNDTIALLSGKMSDAAFQAKYFAGQQQVVAEASAQTSQKVAETTQKVEQLGKTITVHSSDGDKLVKQTFTLVDGVARAAEQSKAELDGLKSSADGAASAVSDVAKGIIHVPDELKSQPKPAEVLTEGLDQVGPAVSTAVEGSKEGIASVGEAWKVSGEAAAGAFAGAAEQTRVAVDGVIAEVSRVQPAVQAALAGGATQQPGEEGQQQAAGIADALAKPFEDGRDRIGVALQEVPTKVTAAVTAIQATIAEAGVGLGEGLVKPFDTAATGVAQALERMVSVVRSQFDAVLSAVQSALTQLQSSVASLEAMAARAEAAAARVRAASQGAAEGRANGGPIGRHAGGGRISGPGTGTSDSILSWLSNGEFVLRAAAVKKYGLDLLYALNGMQLPKDFLKGFATGGAVDFSGVVSRLTDGMRMPRMVPALAEGGAAPAAGNLRPLILDFGGERFEAFAPEDVADRLAKHQGRKGLRKAGKKPGWG